MINLAKSRGVGWMDFKITHSATQEMKPKSAHIERVNQFLVASGFYKN